MSVSYGDPEPAAASAAWRALPLPNTGDLRVTVALLYLRGGRLAFGWAARSARIQGGAGGLGTTRAPSGVGGGPSPLVPLDTGQITRATLRCNPGSRHAARLPARGALSGGPGAGRMGRGQRQPSSTLGRCGADEAGQESIGASDRFGARARCVRWRRELLWEVLEAVDGLHAWNQQMEHSRALRVRVKHPNKAPGIVCRPGRRTETPRVSRRAAVSQRGGLLRERQARAEWSYGHTGQSTFG